MYEEKNRRVINSVIDLYKNNPDRWKNEREAHYDFFKLLFNEFESAEIKDNFKWEYPVGVPDYAKEIDLLLLILSFLIKLENLRLSRLNW